MIIITPIFEMRKLSRDTIKLIDLKTYRLIQLHHPGSYQSESQHFRLKWELRSHDLTLLLNKCGKRFFSMNSIFHF